MTLSIGAEDEEDDEGNYSNVDLVTAKPQVNLAPHDGGDVMAQSRKLLILDPS